MTASIESENSDHICAQAHNTKIAEPYTWVQIRENIVWKNVLQISFFHVGAAASLIYYSFGLHSVPIKWGTIAWCNSYAVKVSKAPSKTFHLHHIVFICYLLSGWGLTAGVHRLWTHRTYKANLPLRIFLMLAYSVAGMNSIFDWAKDHRIHHKFSDSDADPHNPTRGFFFSHMGWMMLRRHPEYIVQARKIDMTDILADPVAMFNKKYATPLRLIVCFVIPTAIPVIFWEETILDAALTQCFIRYVLMLNIIWGVNSVAHRWGDRPYNRFINPADNLFLSAIAGGEGSHNYHHTFPWDYKGSEFPYFNFNHTTILIDAMAKLGWAYDLRHPSPEFIDEVTRCINDKAKVE